MTRQTNQLRQVRQVLENNPEPLSADAIWQAAGQGLNRVTVYRIIKRLVASGEIETTLSGRSRLYRLPHRHPHFHCRGCGRLECLGAVDLEPFKQLVDAQIEHVAIRLEGLCQDCRKH